MARMVLAYFLGFFATASAQPQRSSLVGTVSDPGGAPIGEAPIQAKNKLTGAIARTASKSDGAYTIAGLAAGTYELSIVMPCCAYNPFTRDVTVEPGHRAQLNIQLHGLPGSPPMPGSSAPFIGKIVQTPSLLVILFEDVPGFRQIFLDGRGILRT